MEEQLEQVLEVRRVEREYDGTVDVTLYGGKGIVRSVFLTLEKPEDVVNFPIGKKFNIALAAARPLVVALLVLALASNADAQWLRHIKRHVLCMCIGNPPVIPTGQ